MKKLKLLRLFLIFICLGFFTAAKAQNDYVVTIKGDTVRGKIKFMNYSDSRSVQVITDKKTTYPILQTKAFSLNTETYHPVRTAEGYSYMKIIKEGYLSLYAYQIENQYTWDGRFLLKKDGTGKDLPNLGFKKSMAAFLSDCQTVAKKIESGELTKNKINEIVDEYNTCIQAKTLAVISEPKVENKPVAVSGSWNELETAIRESNDFEGRTDALEMISVIKSKIQQNEKIPGFLTAGLKNSLASQPQLTILLDNALTEKK